MGEREATQKGLIVIVKFYYVRWYFYAEFFPRRFLYISTFTSCASNRYRRGQPSRVQESKKPEFWLQYAHTLIVLTYVFLKNMVLIVHTYCIRNRRVCVNLFGDCSWFSISTTCWRSHNFDYVRCRRFRKLNMYACMHLHCLAEALHCPRRCPTCAWAWRGSIRSLLVLLAAAPCNAWSCWCNWLGSSDHQNFCSFPSCTFIRISRIN